MCLETSHISGSNLSNPALAPGASDQAASEPPEPVPAWSQGEQGQSRRDVCSSEENKEVLKSELHPSLVSHRSECTCRGNTAAVVRGGGCPLSPLVVAAVCQRAQRALVNAFQESGGGERGGEAEGGLALRDAARSQGRRARASQRQDGHRIFSFRV